MATKKTTEATEVEQVRDTRMSAARSAAATRLRDAHLDEYNQFVVEEATARGLEWKPRPTAEQKAAADLAALLEAHPHLREQFTAPTVPTAEVI